MRLELFTYIKKKLNYPASEASEIPTLHMVSSHVIFERMPRVVGLSKEPRIRVSNDLGPSIRKRWTYFPSWTLRQINLWHTVDGSKIRQTDSIELN